MPYTLYEIVLKKAKFAKKTDIALLRNSKSNFTFHLHLLQITVERDFILTAISQN